MSTTSNSPEVETTHAPRNGYDLPVYGLANGQFLHLHIPALVCIALSFICACAIIIASFRKQKFGTFFSWTKGERLAVYIAVCDVLYSTAHTMDHAHMVAIRNHIFPEELCQFYAFFLIEFILAQNIIANVVAVNAFVLIYFRKQLNLGKRDWRLVLCTFALPFLCALVSAWTGKLGTNGSFCYFDAIRGNLANMLFTTVPLALVWLINAVLYIVTWRKIKMEAASLQESLGERAAAVRSGHAAAKTMMLFVAALIIQWWAMTLYGIWHLGDSHPPQLLFHFVTTFSNLGGVINGVVYLLIRRRLNATASHVTTATPA